MAEEFGFYDPVLLPDGTYDREYNAKNFSVPFNALINTGVMKGEMNELTVTSDGLGMITKIDTGIAFINGRYYKNTSFKTHQHDTESLGVSRIDRIAIRMNEETDYRSTLSYVKKGAPSANPVPPTLVQTESVYEISLAQVKIVGGQTFIATNAVVDERGKDVICPWAGSNILPNFNDDALADLVIKVDGLNKTKTYSGDLNDLIEPGIYSVPANTPNAPNNSPLLVEVLTSSDGKFIIQRATYSFLNTSLVPSFTRRSLKDTSGNIVWSTPSSGAVGFVGTWRVVDFILSDRIDDANTNSSATANAVKQLNDLKANKSQESEIAVALQNNWAGNAKYYKDEFGIVHVFFVIYGGTTTANTTLFQLPVGYRPPSTRIFPIITYGNTDVTDTSTHLIIDSTGRAYIQYASKMNITASFSFRT